MKATRDPAVRMIPLAQISVVNSRARGQDKFRQIISNISNIGLKKPITVARRPSREGEDRYDLVCGQGRLEAFMALGQKEIPALVVDASKEDLFLMSLAENLARRQRTSLELARDILAMKERGYRVSEIAKRVDLDHGYVTGVIRLLKQGEDRLLLAVERREIPISMAISISESTDQEVQKAMAEAYQSGTLRGRSLLAARRLLEARRTKGKARTTGPKKAEKGENVSANSLLNAYRKETTRRTVLVSRAKLTETRLLFIVSALKKLLADEGFVTLLRAESLTSMPKPLAAQISGKEPANGP
jgi:ParB family chromosome partitioning protein